MIVPTGLMKQPQINAAVTPPTEFFNAGAPFAGLPLKDVAHSFDILQQQRHTAGYDNGAVWSRTNAIAQIDIAAAAFKEWRAIRDTDEAQDYLPALFLPKVQCPDVSCAAQFGRNGAHFRNVLCM